MDSRERMEFFREIALKEVISYIESLSEERQKLVYGYIFKGLEEGYLAPSSLCWLTKKDIDGIIEDIEEE